MNSRLLSGFVLMVVLPTAVLSLLAVQAVRDQERLLRQSAVAAAEGSIAEIDRSLSARLADDLGLVRLAMTDCLVRGWDSSRAYSAAHRLKTTLPAVAEIYVFMNPWGFLYPGAGGGGMGDIPGQQPEARDESAALNAGTGEEIGGDGLIGELRKRIADSDPSGSVSFALDGESYSFVALQERKSLYAGCRYDAAVLRQMVEERARSYRGGLYRIAVGPVPPRAGQSTVGHEGVVVKSPFSAPGNGHRERRWLSALSLHGGILAEGSLGPPLEGMKLVALAEMGNVQNVTRRSQTRLRGWAIWLLATGILAGVGLVLRQSLSRAREAEARSQFIAGISHDLRTPIAAVQMLGESLSLGRVPDPEKQKMFLDRILQATHRLGDLVERVLFLVKFGQGTVRLASLPVDMAEVVRVSVQTIEARHLADVAEDRPFVSVNMAGGLPNVTGDRGALEQVLMNLLDNAVKYGGKSDGASGRAAGRRFGQAPAVEVSADVVNLNGWRHRGSHVRIRVADSGIGLSRRELRRLFVPFFRGDSARAANLSGVGLGLAVSRDIVRRHCGWIEARGEKGKGSVFSVFLPVA